MTTTSRSRTGEPLVRSRTAPPTRKRVRPRARETSPTVASAAALGGGEAVFEQVDVVGHTSGSTPVPGFSRDSKSFIVNNLGANAEIAPNANLTHGGAARTILAPFLWRRGWRAECATIRETCDRQELWRASRKKVIVRMHDGTCSPGYLPGSGLLDGAGGLALLDLQARMLAVPLARVRVCGVCARLQPGRRGGPGKRWRGRTFLARPRQEGVWLRLDDAGGRGAGGPGGGGCGAGGCAGSRTWAVPDAAGCAVQHTAAVCAADGVYGDAGGGGDYAAGESKVRPGRSGGRKSLFS